jgi:hypothetical protein
MTADNQSAGGSGTGLEIQRQSHATSAGYSAFSLGSFKGPPGLEAAERIY